MKAVLVIAAILASTAPSAFARSRTCDNWTTVAVAEIKPGIGKTLRALNATCDAYAAKGYTTRVQYYASYPGNLAGYECVIARCN